MCINVSGGREGAVSQPDLNLFHGDSISEQQAGAGMPITYNKDKTEKSPVFKGFRACPYSFST